MQKLETGIAGCFEVKLTPFNDARGTFVKTFNSESFASMGMRTDWVEQYFSLSLPGVVRGIHFQLPPHDHAKLVFCISGSVLDVAVDLRKGSPTYGEHVRVELSEDEANMLYLPSGLAHGFCTYDETATLVYNVTAGFQSDSDSGIRWDSAGIRWPHSNPMLSTRDQNLQQLAEFQSPFTFPTNDFGDLSQ